MRHTTPRCRACTCEPKLLNARRGCRAENELPLTRLTPLLSPSLASPHEDTAARLPNPFLGRPPLSLAYATQWGQMQHAKSDQLLSGTSLACFEGKVDLIFTSPPFPLNRKKRYGNEKGEEYVRWLCAFSPLFKKLLTPKGSIAIEMGNSREPSKPVMSTLALRSLLEFHSKNNLHQ